MRSAVARTRRGQQDEEECETLECLVSADHSRVHDAAGHDLSAHTQVQIDSPVLRATVPSRQVQRLAQGYRRTPYVVRTPVHDNSTVVNDPTNSSFTPPSSDRYHTQSEMDSSCFSPSVADDCRKQAAVASPLPACGKTRFIHKMPLESSLWRRFQNRFRMLKKAVQRGRSRWKHRRRSLWATLRMLSR